MSAAAATAARKGPGALPEWCARGGWTPTPNSFFDRLPRALSIFEHAITGFILRATVGNHADGRPEWAQISETRFAALVDGSVNGVSKAIERLEFAGVIEAKKVGRAKMYRCCIEQWDRVKVRGPRKLERVEPEMDDAEAEIGGYESPRAAMRSDDRAEKVEVHCPACHGTGRVSPQEARMIDNALAESNELNERIPPLECGISAAPSAAAQPVDMAGFAEFYALIDGALRGPLASPAPREMMAAQWERLSRSGVGLDYFRARFGMRKHAIRSYGFISMLVDDCLRAAAQAREAGRQASAAGPGEDWTATIKSHVQERVRAISDSALARRTGGVLPFRELVGALKDTAKDAARWASDIPGLEMHLGNLEAMMRSIVEDTQSGEDRAAVDDQVERATGHLRSRMVKNVFDATRAGIYERALFEHHGLPRLMICSV